MLISNKMRLKGEVRADNKELIDDILLYYRKSLNDENRGILRQIIEDFIIDPKNIPHDIDRFCRRFEMDKTLIDSLKKMSALERILVVPRKSKKK